MRLNPCDLNYDHYASWKYEKNVARSFPHYWDFQARIGKIVKKKFAGKEISAMELGTGTGVTAEFVLRNANCASFLSIDFSKNMLKGAHKRLKHFKPTFLCADYAKAKFPKNLDLVVSAISVHHQTHEGKKKLFKKIYGSLNKGGVFILGDMFSFRDKFEDAYNDALHYHYIVAHATNKQVLREWTHHHKYVNTPSNLEDQLEWLKKAGFKSVKIAYRMWDTAIIVSTK